MNRKKSRDFKDVHGPTLYGQLLTLSHETLWGHAFAAEHIEWHWWTSISESWYAAKTNSSSYIHFAAVLSCIKCTGIFQVTASYGSLSCCSLGCYDNSCSVFCQTCSFWHMYRSDTGTATIKLSHFWGQASGFCLQPLYQELEEHGLIWNKGLCSVLAFRPFSCWERGGRSGPWSVTEGVLAAACHVEEQ